MTTVLSRDQADLLAAYGTWQVSWMLTDPATGISHVKGMVSGRLSDDWSWTTDGSGITAQRGRHAAPAAEVVVSWRLIRHAADAVPGHLKAALNVARLRSQTENLRTVAPYCPGGYSPFVQPPPEWFRDARQAEHEALVACLDALALDGTDGVPGQLDLFGDLS